MVRTATNSRRSAALLHGKLTLRAWIHQIDERIAQAGVGLEINGEVQEILSQQDMLLGSGSE